MRHLRSLLEVNKCARDGDVGALLESVARNVCSELGFGTAVVNLRRPASDDFEVVTVCGGEAARAALLGTVTSHRSWERLLDPSFLHRGAYLLPAGAIDWEHADGACYIPPGSGRQGRDTWDPHDALFVPLLGVYGQLHGVLSLDEPTSGRRPSDDELDVLVALASHAGLAIESALRMQELQLAQRNLREERDRAQRYLDVAETIIMVTDAQGRITLANRKARAVLGYTESQMRGADWFDLLVPPERLEQARALWAKIAAGAERPPAGLEGQVVTAEGERRLIAWYSTVLRDDDGRFAGMLSSGLDVTAQRESEQRLAHYTSHDALTGLGNRALLETTLEEAIAGAKESGRSIVMLSIDLDDFKLVNDSLGHVTGDRVLRDVAGRLQALVRDDDMVARHGGDEFLLMVADVGSDAKVTAARLARRVADSLRRPFRAAGTEFQLGASVGIAFYPGDSGSGEELIRHANAALHHAKQAGSGQRAYYHAEVRDSRRQLSLSAELLRGIARGQLELHYQPIFRLADMSVIGVEALVRWLHPRRGLLTPIHFVPFAERSDLIDALGDWVTEEVCAQAARWREQGLLPNVSFNLSPMELRRADLPRRVTTRARAHGVDPTKIVVELTESAWVSADDSSIPSLRALRDAELVLAMDDFGAGWSSLARLRELTVDMIKVDRAFLHGIPQDPRATEMLVAILRLASACGSGVVIEGVETEEQLRFLEAQGAPMAQGFHLGRPAPQSEITPLLVRELASDLRRPLESAA